MKASYVVALAATAAAVGFTGCATGTTGGNREPAQARGEHMAGGGERAGGGGGEAFHGGDPHPEAPRTHGVPAGRTIPVRTPHGVVDHPVIHDPRPIEHVHNDPHLVRLRRGDNPWVAVHVEGRWNHFYRTDWLANWRFGYGWDRVDTVTCEAVNTSNNELFPITGSHTDWAWSDDTVNQILDEALDYCYATSPKDADGNMEGTCVPAEPDCTPAYIHALH
jgi:hypothetical protein